MEVEVTQCPALRMGVVHGELARAQQTWERFGQVTGLTAGAPGHQMASLVGIEALTGPADPTKVRYDAGLVIAPGAALPAGLSEVTVPAGTYAHATYLGGYEGLAAAWHEFAGEWLPQSGRRAGLGLAYEVYAGEPEGLADSARRTDLYIPLA